MRAQLHKISILIVFFILLSFIIIRLDKTDAPLPVVNNAKTEEDRLQYFKNATENIKADAFSIYNIKDGKVIYSKNADSQLPLASITKIMSALIIDEKYPDFELIEIDKDAILQEGDSGLFQYEKWNKDDLLDFTLLTSSNDGIYALSSSTDKRLFEENIVTIMNTKAKELGMDNTVFFNTSGLDIDSGLSGAYSSASDITKLLSYITRSNSKILSATAYENNTFISENNLKHIAKNTNTIIGEIPSAIASKTGFTDLAKGNLAFIFDVGMLNPVAIVLLGSQDSQSRFTDAKELILGTLYYYSI